LKLQIINFEGLVPRVAKRLLGDSQAQVAENCDLLSGNLRAIKETGLEKSGLDADQISIFPYNSGWLTWDSDVDVVRSFLASDQYDRIYYAVSGAAKIRGVDTAEAEYTLGIPAPATAPTAASKAKTALTWTRRGPNGTDGTWGYQYEDPQNGNIMQSGELTEGTAATEVDVASYAYLGVGWHLETLPAKTSARSQDVFVMWFDAYDEDGITLLGRIYPDSSWSRNKTDLKIEGAAVTAKQWNNISSPPVVFWLYYDTSRASEYEVERSYIYSYVSGWDEEGPPSDASAEVSVSPVQDALVSGLPIAAPAGDYNITHYNLYRSSVTDAGTEYQLVAKVEIGAGTATYLDKLKQGDLTTTMISTYYDPPQTGIAGIVAMPGEFIAGFIGKTVWFSEPGEPHAWPVSYGITVDYDIVGLKVTENTLVVATEGVTYALTGNHPNQIVQSQFSLQQSCVSKRGMVNVSGRVMYPSPDGLVLCEGGVGMLVTEGYYTRKQWNALSPSSIIASVYDGRYYGWTDTSSIIWDFDASRSALTTTTVEPIGLYSDLETDTLYMVVGTEIRTWREGDDNLAGRWKTKLLQTVRPDRPNVVQLYADSYPQTLLVYADGTLVQTMIITSSDARRFLKFHMTKQWEFEINFDDDVHALNVAPSMLELE